MKLTTKRTCEITITLSENEAKILKAVLQNPPNHMSPEDELFQDHNVRCELFNYLHEALGGWNPAG